MASPMPSTCTLVPKNSSTEPKEDCRDYLRTGRCKYGASCKYNHPPNVQSGGGMKTPLDPSEPMFPIRPNEPVCQYYMKHGTCKFGQTCKFHHPPQASMTAGNVNGNSLLAGGARKNDPPQLLWSPSGGGGGDASASANAGMQLLPQRPDEPNCIYFLKHGRCKYGAACRYHHPLNIPDRRPGADDIRRQQHIQVQQVAGDTVVSPKIHYVTSLPAGSYPQGHFVVSDGTVTFVSLDGSAPPQIIPVGQAGKEGTVVYTTSANTSIHRPLGLSREVASSSSSASIASSYETSSSNVDPLLPHGDTSGSLWSRPNVSASQGSLNGYNIPEAGPHGRAHIVQGNRNVMVQNDGMGLPRVVSSGSTGDSAPVYYDNTAGAPRQSQPLAHTPNGSNPVTWRGRRSNSFDHTRSGPSSLYSQDEEVPDTMARSLEEDGFHNGYFRDRQRSPMVRSRPPPGVRPQRRPQQNVEVDDGLSMMTSALLTMLDTPEEAAAEYYEGYEYNNPTGHSSQTSTPRMRPQYPPSRSMSEAEQFNLEDARTYQQPQQQYTTYPSYTDQNPDDDRMLGLMMPSHHGQQTRMESMYDRNPNPQKNIARHPEGHRWQQNWQGIADYRRPAQETDHSLPVSSPQTTSTSSHSSSNVGLFLP